MTTVGTERESSFSSLTLKPNERGVNKKTKRFVRESIAALTFVKAVRETTAEEKAKFKVDYLIHFTDGKKHITVGLTLRNTPQEIKDFRSSLEPGKRIIGLWANKETSFRALKVAFVDELTKLDGSI